MSMDRYALGLMAEEESSEFEEHLLLCSDCQERLAENDAFVKAMQAASVEYVKEKGRTTQPLKMGRAPTLVAVAAGILLWAGAVVWQRAQAGEQPAIVKLAPYGSSGAKAPAGRKLLLYLDILGLPDLPSYELEIVDRWGNPVLRVSAKPGSVPAPALRAGSYSTRLYAGGGQLLREYRFEVLDRPR